MGKEESFRSTFQSMRTQMTAFFAPGDPDQIERRAYYKRIAVYSACAVVGILSLFGILYMMTGVQEYGAAAMDETQESSTTQSMTEERKDLEKQTTAVAPGTKARKTPWVQTAPPASLDRPLLCHFSSKMGRSTAFPEDGLCDFIYHVHLNVDQVFKREPKHWNFKDHFAVFLENARVARKTMYGVSISFKKGNFTRQMLQTPAGEIAWRELWKRNIKHYGMLGVHGSLTEIEAIHANHLGLLKTLRHVQSKISQQMRDPKYHFLALGLQLDYTEWERHKRAFVAKISELTTEFPVDLFIFQSHTYVFRQEEPCRVHGPALWHKNFKSHLPSIDAAAKMLAMSTISNRTTVLLSLTLSGMLYTLPSMPESKKMIGVRCHNFSTAYEYQICKLPPGFSTPKRDDAALVMYSVNRDNLKVYTWDDIKSLRAKMNRTLRAYRREHFGWAAFDFVFEDYSNVCNDTVFGMGFHRLRAIRQFLKWKP